MYKVHGRTGEETMLKNVSELNVGLGERAYPICIGSGYLHKIGGDLARRNIANRYCIIADETVAGLYGEIVEKSLHHNNLQVECITFPAGEESKNLKLYAHLCSLLAQKGYDRKDGIIALGGGVAGDLAGFVAATYLRGIPFVQIPTTLLAQVDSSVGGKTGVDIPEGKNLVGAFYQPKAVYIDIDVLKTLPKDEFLGGMAEVIKYGVIRDSAFFDYLVREREAIFTLEPGVLEYVVQTCCQIKADVVAADEWEADLRRILNFGHTIGHAVEAVSGFAIIHGNAVAIGMTAATRIAQELALLSAEEGRRIITLLQEYELPTEIPNNFDRRQIKKFLQSDKKIVAGKIAYILPTSIGNVRITSEVPEDLVDLVLSWPQS